MERGSIPEMSVTEKKILLIQTAFPGDLILATPLFEAIKEMDKTVFLSLVTHPKNAALFEHSPFVDDLVLYDKSGSEKGLLPFLRLVGKIRKERFDIALIPQPSLRSALIACFSGAGRRTGFARSWCSFMYPDSVDVAGVRHEVARNRKRWERWGGC